MHFKNNGEDNSSAEEMETSLISSKPSQDQAEDIASPKEKGKGKKKRTQPVDSPLSRNEQKRAKRKVNVLELENENASLKVQIDKLKKRLAKQKEQFASQEKEKMQQTIEESTFRYTVVRSYGIRYMSACRDERELECPCVIVNYKNNHPDNEDKAISQLKLYRKMGNEYALEVLHIDNRPGMSGVNVIYPFFENTMSEWLKKLKANDRLWPQVKDHGKWMKVEVMPKIRKLWKLLLEMKDKKIHSCNEVNDQGYNMALINEVPKLFNLREGHENLDMNYAIGVSREIVDLDTALEFVPKNFLSALENSWEDEIKNETINYWLCSKHPILYDPAEKKAFLLLMHDITFRYGLKDLLNVVLDWSSLLQRMNSVDNKANQNVYFAILHRGSHYSTGFDIVRYMRNALMHFEETYRNYNHKKWDRRRDGEIVEILDNDLDVCSFLFSIARAIMTDNAPQRDMNRGRRGLTEEDRLKAREELENFFSSLK